MFADRLFNSLAMLSGFGRRQLVCQLKQKQQKISSLRKVAGILCMVSTAPAMHRRFKWHSRVPLFYISSLPGILGLLRSFNSSPQHTCRKM
jgi:hypothetical protein